MRQDRHLGGEDLTNVDRSGVVVAGPSSSLTIPGIIVSQIVGVLSLSNLVTRIEVNLGNDFDAGLFRAPSLAAAHAEASPRDMVVHEAPNNTRLRSLAFREWIKPDVRTAIAFIWPGIDNSWIRQYFQAARVVGASTVIVCVSLPKSNPARVASMAESMYNADLVVVGESSDAMILRSKFGSTGPTVETHRALSLRGRSDRSSVHKITAFLPRDNTKILTTLLAAFDALPEAWIESYSLQIAMRYSGGDVPGIVANSHHRDFVQLVGEDISSPDLEQLCAASSALIIADPAFDSRAFSVAVECGVATVVLVSTNLPEVGSGYVGGLLANQNHPVSVHVGLMHALRLSELQFPPPDAWGELAERLFQTPATEDYAFEGLAPASRV